nr:MAG TPA: hypothetical protein [Caudoviricetes sp.]
MRLIDKDTLGVSRCNPDVFKVPGRAEGWNSLLDIVNSAPTIDAAPVVRCRECKYHKPIDYCTKHKQTGWFDDNFCSYGEQREATHD